MTTYYLAALINGGTQFFSNQGVVLAGGFVYVYQAGSLTPQNTYTDSTGGTLNANPLQLDSAGRVTQEVWIPSGTTVKFIVTDSTLASVGPTLDNVPGINDPSTTAGGGVNLWNASGVTPAYVSGTQFTASGDQTSLFPVGTRVKFTCTAGTGYATVSASSYTPSTTTVTLKNDSISLDSGLSAVYVSAIPVTGSPAGAGVTPFQASVAYTGKNVGAAINALLTGTTTAGTSTAYTLAIASAVTPAVYAANQSWVVNFHTASGASPTLNVASLGAKSLKQYDSSGNKVAATILTGQVSVVIYDGTDMVVLSPAGNSIAALSTGGVAGTYTLTPPATVGAYVTGQTWLVIFNASKTDGTQSTLNVSGLGAKNLKQILQDGTKAITPIYSNQISWVTYDGTDMIVLDSVVQGQQAVTTSGSGSAYTAVVLPTPVSYVTNAFWTLSFHADSSGATPTLNLNGLGAKNLKQFTSTGSKVRASILSGQVSRVVYDGTDLVILDSGSTGRFLKRTVYTTTGTFTYTRAANTAYVIAQGIGGGGPGDSTDTSYAGGGGGAGGHFWGTFVPAATETVIVGAGGTARNGTNAPSTGGNSQFGTFGTANGGMYGMSALTTAGITYGYGGRGGSASGGQINLRGGGGQGGGFITPSGDGLYGMGGNSVFGGGAPAGPVGGTGTQAYSGEDNTGGGGAYGLASGNGGSGIVIVDEYT